MEFHDILELNGSSLLENYKEESFLIAYEICFNVFGAVSQIETKLEIIDRLRIWKENGETATHAQGLLDREKNLFKKLTDTYSFGSSGAVGLLHEILKNSNDAQSIYQLIQIKKQRVQELKNTLEKLSHTSPEQIRLRWIEQKEREARQKVEMRRVSYLSKWQKNYLIANLSADLTGTQKQYLEDLFSICVDVFITKEVFYNSQKISEKASEMWQDKNGESLGHLLIGPKPFSELISLFWWLGNPGSIPKDAYDFISLKRPIIFSEIFWIFERFAMNKEEALFLASHFPISEDLNEVNQTEEKEAFLAVVSKTLAESELDERSRSRFESIRNQNSSLKYESLSSAHLLELAKNPDLLNPSIPVHELFRRNIPNEEVKRELKSDFNNKHVVALIDEALARNGDKEALKRILKTRISISQKKRLNRISPESMAEIVQLCFGENTDSEYLKIAQAELEMYKCPNLLLETFGTSKVNFKEHLIVGQILIEAGFGTRFVQNLEQRSDLMENEDLQKLYLSTAIKCEMPPKALNRSTHLQGDVFKEVLLLFLNRGSSEDLNLFCSRNREKMELAFQDASIRETLKTVSNETAFTLNVKLELDYPELHYKAARYAKSAYPDEFENQLGRLRAE
jgi:hypothetical protein